MQLISPFVTVKGRWYLVQGGDSRPGQVLIGLISGTPRLCYVTDALRVQQSTSELADRLLTQLVSICFHTSFSFNLIKCHKCICLVKFELFPYLRIFNHLDTFVCRFTTFLVSSCQWISPQSQAHRQQVLKKKVGRLTTLSYWLQQQLHWDWCSIYIFVSS